MAFSKRSSLDSEAPQALQPGLETYVHDYPQLHARDPKFLPEVNDTEPWQSDIRATANHGLVQERQPRKLLDLRLKTFSLSVALAVAVAIAIGLGGSLGATVARRDDELAAAKSTIKRLQSLTAAPAATQTGSNGIATVTVTAKATPTSDCAERVPFNYTAPHSGTRYTMLCGTDLSTTSPRQVYFEGVQSTFEDCIDMCDTYNFQTGTTNVTSINYNYKGVGGGEAGECWCTNALSGEYSIMNAFGHDSAWQVGTFSDAP